MASSCVHIVRRAAIHPCNYHQHQTFRKPSSPTYVKIRGFSSFPNTQQLIITQKYKLQFLSPKTQQNPNFFFTSSFSLAKSTTAALCEANSTSSKITPNTPATEILILVFMYIIPFLNHRLNLLTKFPVLRLATKPILPLLGIYHSIPPLGLITVLALFIGFVRYRRRNLSKLDSLQPMLMDCLVVIASIIRQDPLARGGGALGFKFQLLNVLEYLSFQTCVLTCLEYLKAVPWVVSCPSVKSLARIIEVVLKTEDYLGRRKGKSVVVKLLRENDSLLSDVNSAETCNRIILSSCQSCLHSLLKLFKIAAYVGFSSPIYSDRSMDKQISLEADNLLWLLDILVDRQAAEEFALMWAKQQKLANLHTKFWMPSRHLVSCITTRLFVGIGNGEILPAIDTRQRLLLTWYQPLVDDYPCLQRLSSFDRKVVEENIERERLELRLEDQQRVLLSWFGCGLKGGICSNLQKAFEGWCRRTFSSKRPSLSLTSKDAATEENQAICRQLFSSLHTAEQMNQALVVRDLWVP